MNDRQYIAIAAGGRQGFGKLDDALVVSAQLIGLTSTVVLPLGWWCRRGALK